MIDGEFQFRYIRAINVTSRSSQSENGRQTSLSLLDIRSNISRTTFSGNLSPGNSCTGDSSRPSKAGDKLTKHLDDSWSVPSSFGTRQTSRVYISYP